MALTLSSDELAKCRMALATLLSPFAHEGLAEWQSEVCKTTVPLMRADRALSLWALGGQPTMYGDAQDAGAIAEWASYYHRLDAGFLVRRKQLGLEVYHRDALYDRNTVQNTELWNDWVVPHKLFDPLGMGITIEGQEFPAMIHYYHDSDAAHPFGRRGVAVLRLLLPAFKAGVRAWRQLADWRSDVAGAIDSVPAALLVTYASGQAVHQSRALGPLLASDPERGRLSYELSRVAMQVAALSVPRSTKVYTADVSSPVARVVRTNRAAYRVSASWVAPGVLSSEGVVVALLEKLAPKPVTDDGLRDRYRLTPREIRVARLAAGGHSAAEIARQLGIGTHTARRHLERVRNKMGRHRIAEVAATLRSEAE